MFTSNCIEVSERPWLRFLTVTPDFEAWRTPSEDIPGLFVETSDSEKTHHNSIIQDERTLYENKWKGFSSLLLFAWNSLSKLKPIVWLPLVRVLADVFDNISVGLLDEKFCFLYQTVLKLRKLEQLPQKL